MKKTSYLIIASTMALLVTGCNGGGNKPFVPNLDTETKCKIVVKEKAE